MADPIPGYKWTRFKPEPFGSRGGGGGGACTGTDAENTALCLHSQPGNGGGSSLVPPGGSYILTDDSKPSVSITVTQYGWWGHP